MKETEQWNNFRQTLYASDFWGRYVTFFSKNCKNLMMTDTGRNM